MRVTFTPGPTYEKGEDETTSEKYQLKLKEKEMRQREKPKQPRDDFNVDSGSEEDVEETKKGKKENEAKTKDASEPRTAVTAEEPALLVAPQLRDSFGMSVVLKAEERSGKKGKKCRGERHEPNDQDTQEDFHIDVTDKRFKALHGDHSLENDPSNSQ